MLISIVALDMHNGIGREGKIPWELPEDIRFFRNVTRFHTCIMGSATRRSLPLGYLPKRDNWVLTSSRTPIVINGDARLSLFPKLADVLRAASLEEEDVYVIGGGTVYTQLMPYIQRQMITRIDGHFECDTFYPDEYQSERWLCIREEPLHQRVQDYYGVLVGARFLTYERRPGFAALPLKPL